MSAAMAHPYHAAFCFMTVWGMEDPMGLLQQAIGPFRDELKKNPSDERMAQMQQAVYDTLLGHLSFAKHCSTHTTRKPNT